MLQVIAGWQLAEAGLREEACQVFGEVGAKTAGSPIAAWALFHKFALEGDLEGALTQATPEFERGMTRNELCAHVMAQNYALLGRLDDGLRWLRIAIDGGFTNYPCLAEHDPFLVGLRDDPRFEQLMAELKPRWEAIVAWESSR